jgi:phage-related protein
VNVFIWNPSQAPTKKAPRVRKAQFEEQSFAHRGKDGINRNPRTIQLTFEKLPIALGDDIEDFLEAAGGTTPFLWTPLGKPQAAFVCPEWDRDYQGMVSTITATFEEYFAP